MNDIQKDTVAIYIFDSETTPSEYGEMTKYFPRFYWQYMKTGTLLSLSIVAFCGMINELSKISSILMFVFYEIFMLFIYKLRLTQIGKKSFIQSQQRYPTDTYFTNKLYEEYFIRYGEYTTRKIPYKKISRTIETDTHFYMELDGGIIILQKYRCTDEIIEFLREKCRENLNITKRKLIVEKVKNQEMLKRLMHILFILNCICIPLAARTFYLLNTDIVGFQFFENCWIFWLWLPIPILSFVLGLKFKNTCASFDKNVLSGFIVGVILLLLGCFCFFSINEEKLINVNSFTNVVDSSYWVEGEVGMKRKGFNNTKESKLFILTKMEQQKFVFGKNESIC